MTDEYAGDDLTGFSDYVADVLEEEPDEDRSDSTEQYPDEWAIRRIVVTMVPLLAALSVLQMASGTVLETFEEVLLVNPALLVLVPVQIGAAGNLGSILCSRLSTQLYLGTLEFHRDDPNVRANVGAIFLLGFTVFVLVGIAAWAVGTVLGGALGLVTVMTISIVSGMLLTTFVVVVSFVSVLGSFRAGLNPDDTTIPIVTNVCDVTGVIILFGVTTVVL